MTLIEIAKVTWNVAGITAPAFAWVVSAVLVTTTMVAIVRIAISSSKESRQLRRVSNALSGIKRQPGDEGVNRRDFQAICDALSQSSATANSVDPIRASAVIRRDSYWRAVDLEQTLVHAVSRGRLDRSHYASFPGIITGVGLLFTFIAILVALLDVRLEKHQVQGLDNLIHGLSGKFVSSIAALAAASVFMIFERATFSGVISARRALGHSLNDLIPMLPTAQILSEMQDDLREQRRAVTEANTAIASLEGSFSPKALQLFEQMAQSLNSLQETFRAIESRREDQFTSSLDSLIQNLERSITSALETMTARFTESVSGATRSEFGRVVSSLGSTVDALTELRSHLDGSKEAIASLISLAQNSAAEQVAHGKASTAEVTATLRQLMAELATSSERSISQVSTAFESAFAAMSAQTRELQSHLTRSVEQSSGTAAEAARTVIERADSWSAASRQHLEELISRQQEVIASTSELRTLLKSTFNDLAATLSHYSTINHDLQKIAAETASYVAKSQGATQAIVSATDTFKALGAGARSEIEKLAKASEEYRITWDAIQGSMNRYSDLFAQVESNVTELIEQLAKHLRDYVEASRHGFEQVIAVSDGYFKDATTSIGRTVQSLEDQLQNLEESLDSFAAKLSQTRGR